MTWTRFRLVSLAALVALQPMATGAAFAATRPDFSGTWRINDDLSENPRDMIEEARPDGPPRGGFGGPPAVGIGGLPRGGPGAGPPGGPYGGVEGPGSREERRTRMRERLHEIEQGTRLLRITHQDPRFTIRYANDVERVLYTDGRDLGFAFAGDLWEARAKWKKGRKIVLKSKSSRGRKITETYEFSEDGRRLHLTTKMAGDGRLPPIEFRRVYDAVDR
jgi:hypothetical protein